MARISGVKARREKKESAAKLLEKHVTGQVKDFLVWRQWRPVRMQRTVIAGAFQAGEPGMCDYEFIKYFERPIGASLTIWVEFKAPGKELRKGQPEWHARERARGAVVLVVDNFEDFEQLYYREFGWLHSGDRATGQLELTLG